MIDFAHPKSKRFLYSRIFTSIIVVLFVAGIYLLFSPFQAAFSDEQNSLGGFTNLPANLPPDEYILEDLHLPVNEVIPERIQKEVVVLDQTTVSQQPKVLGVSYNDTAVKQLQTTKTVNKIVIPKMGVDAEILEGKNDDMLWKGIWRMPIGSTPNQDGNTIITAHRYLHKPPSPKTFYLIDKMEIGDVITLYWEGIKYEYAVVETKIIEPTEVEILHNTSDDRLTIFSCTPLFTSQQRLVVIAKKI
jgi:LPXTG-site transpeptidase (sortase) family protein